MQTTTYSRTNHSLLGYVESLRDDFLKLVHEEVQLAKTEVSEKMSHVRRHGINLAIGGALGFLAIVFLLLALGFIIASGFEHLGLSTGIALFLGFLVIAVVCGVPGLILVLNAIRAFSKQSLVPEKTIATLSEVKNGTSAHVPIKTGSIPSAPKDQRSSDQVVSEIEETRHRIHQDVTGIRHRLRIPVLMGEAVTRVKNHPLRTAGIGLGTGLAGWVLVRGLRFLGRKQHA